MKKILILIFAICVLSLVSCTSAETKDINIGVSQCSDDEWRQKMNEDLRREAILHNNMKLEIRSADDNNEKQISDIYYFIKEKVDLLVVSPNEARAIAPAVAKAYDAGIPVIVADRSVEGDKYTAYIGADNEEMGEMQGLYVAHELGGNGRVIEITGLRGSTPAVGRHTGLVKALKNYPGIEIVGTAQGNWLRDSAYAKMDSLLDIYGDNIDMVVAQNDRMAMGAYMATEKRYPGNKIKFMGVDALTSDDMGVDDVEKGILDATLIYPNGSGQIIETALKILNGEPFARHQILSTALVDKSNAHLLMMQANEVKRQTDKVGFLKGQVDIFWDRYQIQTSLLYAVLVIAVLFMAITFLALKAYWAKQTLNKRLNQQKQELEEQRDKLLVLTKELEEATHSKLVFFTNVSHDFRTPLTLIADPVEQVLNSGELNDRQHMLLSLANKNVKILLRLINQILDFRKFENGKMSVTRNQVDLRAQIMTWYGLFEPLARKKHQHLSINSDDKADYVTKVDVEKTERIFFNIMGNAIKYTDDNGKIDVSVERVTKNGGDWVEFRVSNTGEGISAEHINHIFERFYQIKDTYHEGSGIGLALVKTFVDVQGGMINVESVEDSRVTFTVDLPVISADGAVEAPKPMISEQQISAELGNCNEADDEPIDDIKQCVLIIDDNADIRFFVHQLLGDNYTVIEAKDGQQGLAKARKYVPDVVLCDVMMPGMDGMEVCRQLKSYMPTSHIPVLMLTACSLDEQRVNGLENGADAYLSKPFNSQVLMAQIKSLIENRGRIKQFFGDTATLVEEKVSTIDKDFVGRFKELIEVHIGDSEITVEDLGDKLGMSRVQLYRKIKTLTNYSPVELLRISRLKHASKLLVQSELTIAEVAYNVGFTSPSYFTKCYKEYFGENPSEVIKKRC